MEVNSQNKAEGDEKPPEVKFFENSLYLLKLFKKTINDAVKKGYKGFLHANLINLAEKNFEGYEPSFMIETFIHRSFKHWDHIQTDNLEETDPSKLKQMQDKQDKFICENASILFSGPVEKFIDIKKVVLEIYEKKFNKNDTIITVPCRASVMKTLKSFVKYSVEYLQSSSSAKEKLLKALSPSDQQTLLDNFEKYKAKMLTTE